ncbi:acyltransferase family protein [Anianabacter salinae]|uniref:acyltransferase family protein n=1 Tax=Anianabacter salinae TaxID=2851023 RepID=UPI00225E0D6C|nr:acyltransferase family protein [Anianabacter salinae]MBV0911380.1 acyltransferase [Anianabacter salinae]
MRYRPEIDGLRAVAILPVLGYHAGIAGLSGGFVGVDVFFVISGYLITTLILAERAEGSFSLWSFYERRARRILPPLILVMAACVPFAWALMLPIALKDFGQSIVATTFFVENVLLWREGGYFGQPSEFKPLHHLWSLSIEEQFYLVFPVLVLLLARLRRGSLPLVLGALTLASFCVSEWMVRTQPSAAYLMPHARAWELLVGALCALALRRWPGLNSTPLAAAGLAMIAASVTLYSDATPFPGVAALLPVGGAALVILFAPAGAPVAALLSLRLAVGIGLLSYGVYLWHMPLYAFARIVSVGTPPDTVFAALALASFVLAYASWRWLEQPIRGRRGRLLPGLRRFAPAAAVAVSGLCAFGVFVHVSHGAPGRLSPEVLALAIDEATERPGTCGPISATTAAAGESGCAYLGPEGGFDLLIVGDSHAAAVASALLPELRRGGVTHRLSWQSGCIGLPGLTRPQAEPFAREACDRLGGDVGAFLSDPRVKAVMIAARFPAYLLGTRFDNGEGGREQGRDLSVTVEGAALQDDAARKAAVLAHLRTTLEQIARERALVLVYPVPEAGWQVPQTAAAQGLVHGLDRDLTTPLDRFEARTAEITALFDSLTGGNIQRVRPAEHLCDTATRRCRNTQRATALYFDDDHLSLAGSSLLVPDLMRAIAAALSGR